MQTIIYRVILFNGSEFRVFCKGKNQIKRFSIMKEKLKNEIWKCEEILNGIHEIKQFEKLTIKN